LNPARRSIAIFPGSFNPPTNAHVALIQSAAREVDRVFAVLPRAFPHKSYSGPSLDERLSMLDAARAVAPFETRVTEGGLFIDIAREFRAHHPAVDIWFVCGRDAAQRIVEWDYGHPAAIVGMLDEFGLLVASRQGEYKAPEHIAARVRRLSVSPDVDGISATQVRTLIERGEPWEHLVPEAVAPLVSRYYAPRPSQSTSE